MFSTAIFIGLHVSNIKSISIQSYIPIHDEIKKWRKTHFNIIQADTHASFVRMLGKVVNKSIIFIPRARHTHTHRIQNLHTHTQSAGDIDMKIA